MATTGCSNDSCAPLIRIKVIDVKTNFLLKFFLEKGFDEVRNKTYVEKNAFERHEGNNFHDYGTYDIGDILQMPVVMVPIHFDRDPVERKVSTLRSYVLRPFITNDFMTGVAALPGRDIPEKVSASEIAKGRCHSRR